MTGNTQLYLLYTYTIHVYILLDYRKVTYSILLHSFTVFIDIALMNNNALTNRPMVNTFEVEKYILI